MVVDDEEFCISIMKQNLKCAGVDDSRIDYCITGKEALTLTKESHMTGITYGLIITDFSMPIMNGIESTR